MDTLFEPCCDKKEHHFNHIVAPLVSLYRHGVLAPLGSGIVAKDRNMVMVPYMAYVIDCDMIKAVIRQDGEAFSCAIPLGNERPLWLTQLAVHFATGFDKKEFLSQQLPRLFDLDIERLSALARETGVILPSTYMYLYRQGFVYPVVLSSLRMLSHRDMIKMIDDKRPALERLMTDCKVSDHFRNQ